MPGEPHFVSRVFSYMAVHQRIIAQPSFVIEVSAQMPVKTAALQAYESQFTANPSNSGIIRMMEDSARMWGGMANVEAGEPFFALETIALDSPLNVL
jgi:LmbE family N-acetylglucosaminyl deacetylase